MAKNPETLQNPSPNILLKSPDDTLLKNFRVTLDESWRKFDDAVPLIGKVGPSSDENYKKVKQEYESAISILGNIKNDDELRANGPIRQKLDNTIKILRTYNAQSDKQKAYNKALVEMEEKLAELQRDVEKNNATLPVVVTTVASLKLSTGESTLSTGISGMVGELTRETLDTAKEEIGAIRKNPLRKIAEWMGFTEDAIISDIKGGLEKMKDAKGFGRISAKFSLMISVFMARIFGIDMTKSFTPEEMKLAGIQPKNIANQSSNISEQQKPRDAYSKNRFIFEGLFLSNSTLPISDILENIQMKGTTLGDLQAVSTSKQFESFLRKIGRPVDEKNIEGLRQILEVVFSGKKGKYILEAYNSSKSYKKDTPYPTNITFGEYIVGAGTILSNMRGLAKAAVTQKMPEPDITLDSSGEVIVTENNESLLKLLDGDKKLLGFMLGRVGGASQWKVDTLEKEAMNHNGFRQLYPTPETQKKAISSLRKVLEYSDNFITIAIRNPDIHLGMQDELSDIQKNRTFRLRGVALMYMSLGGKDIANFSNFSTIEQAQVYGMIMTIFQTEDSAYKKGQLTSRYLSRLNSSKASIPSGVKEFMIDAGEYAVKKTGEGILEGLNYFLGLANENPRLAAAFIALNLNFIPARNSVVDYIF